MTNSIIFENICQEKRLSIKSIYCLFSIKVYQNIVDMSSEKNVNKISILDEIYNKIKYDIIIL